jgi:hypothetical protein
MKKQLEEDRIRDIQMLKANSKNASKIIIQVKPELDKRLEVLVEQKKDQPPPSLFIGLGYNKVSPAKEDRHYRRYYPDELEQVKEVIPRKPFHEESIYRGASQGAKGWLSSMFKKNSANGAVEEKQEVGYFKGLIKAYNKAEMAMTVIGTQERNNLVLKLLHELYQRKKGQPMSFNFDKLETFEGRGKFTTMMEELGLG